MCNQTGVGCAPNNAEAAGRRGKLGAGLGWDRTRRSAARLACRGLAGGAAIAVEFSVAAFTAVMPSPRLHASHNRAKRQCSS